MPPRTPTRRPAALAAALVALVLVAGGSAAFAYTIYLKDGSRLITTEKYTVRGDKAILRLQNGTETMLPLDEIDVARTEQTNQGNLGTAVVIEDGKAADLTRNAAPPPRKPTLQDLIQSRGPAGESAPPLPPPVRRERSESQRPADEGQVVGRAPLRNVELASSIREFLFGRGVSSVEVLQGPSARRPLLVYTATNEGQVFKALAASAVTLIYVREIRPADVDSFEVLCRSPDGGPGGRFTMTPEMAQDLVAGRISMPEFFVRYVQF